MNGTRDMDSKNVQHRLQVNSKAIGETCWTPEGRGALVGSEEVIVPAGVEPPLFMLIVSTYFSCINHAAKWI